MQAHSSRALMAALLALTVALAGCASDEPAEASDDADGGDAGEGDEMPGDGGDGGAGGEPEGNDTEPQEPEDPDGNETMPGNGTGQEPAPPVEVEVSSAGQYPLNPSFDPATLSVPAGATVNLTFHNADDLPLVQHDWVLEDMEGNPVDGAATDQVANGQSAEITFTAPMEPGEYPYYCSVGDHREQGMEGVLTITAAA